MKLRLDRGTIGGWALVLLIMAGLGWVLYRATTRFITTSDPVAHSFDVLRALEDVLLQAADIETAQSGYVSSGGEEHLVRYRSTSVNLYKSLTRLTKLTTNSAEQQKRLALLESAIAAKLALSGETMDVRTHQGALAASQMASSGPARQQIDEIRRMVRLMQDEEGVQLASQTLIDADRARFTITALLIGGLLIVTLLLSAFYVTRRETIERRREGAGLRRASDRSELRVEARTSELASANEDLRLEVAERRRTEEALRASQQKFFMAFNLSPFAMSIVRIKDDRYLDVNDSSLRLSGYSREEVVGHTDLELNVWTDPGDRARFQQVFREYGRIRELELCFRTKSGALRDFLLSAEGIEVDGEPCLLIAVNEVTERNVAEKAIRASEGKYRLLFEENPHPMWVFDLNTLAFLEVNQAAISHYGYSREEFLAMTARDFRPAEDVPALEALSAVPEGIGTGGVWRHVKKDGAIINVEITAHNLGTKDPPTCLVLGLDVTERKRVESALRESEELFRTLAETASDPIITIDATSTIIFVNQAVERVFGYTPSELIGSKLTILMPEYLRRLHEAGIDRYSKTGQRHISWHGIDLPGLHRDGHEIPLLISFAEFHKDGRQYFSGFARDITERKRVEEEIGRLNDQLEHRVAQRTIELEAANREMEAFSYSVSHDLRAPLRAMAGFSRILFEEYGPQLPEEGQQYLQTVQDNAQQMGRLIDDLLALSQLGRRAINKEQVGPADLVLQVLDELKRAEPQRHLEVTVGDLPVCQADPALLKQVFVNLLANSLKFTRQREVAVIDIGSLPKNGHSDGTVYFVKDNGTGFDMQYASKLFGVFQRLHRAADYEGTGVGLAIVQRIINRHGGRVWAEAKVDNGATFYFTLEGESNDRQLG